MSPTTASGSRAAQDDAEREALAYPSQGNVVYALPDVDHEGGVLGFEQDTRTWETVKRTLDVEELETLKRERGERIVDVSLTPAWAYSGVEL